MTTRISCPKCGGTDSYESLQNGKRVPMCKQCSEVMYAPGTQAKQEKAKSAGLFLVGFFGTLLVLGIFALLLI